MSEIDLAAIEARCNAATPGPWRVGYATGRCTLPHVHGVGDCDYRIYWWDDEDFHTIARDIPVGAPYDDAVKVCGNYNVESGGVVHECDAAFIAHARSDIPALIARVRELEALVQHMKHTTYCAYCGFEVTIDSPDSSIVVAEHIRTCDKHPLGERVRWLEKELLDMDSRGTKYRVRAEQAEARVAELEKATRIAAIETEERCIEEAKTGRERERERCLRAVDDWLETAREDNETEVGIFVLEHIREAIERGE